jgi:hypothetical protein
MKDYFSINFIIKLSYIIMAILSFVSCKEVIESDKVILAEIDAKTPISRLKLENGYFVFESKDHLNEVLKEITNMSPTAIEQWHNELKFVSRQKSINEAFKAYELAQANGAANLANSSYEKELIVSEDGMSAKPKFPFYKLAAVLNSENLTKIGSQYYLFTEDKLIQVADKTTIELKDLRTYTKSDPINGVYVSEIHRNENLRQSNVDSKKVSSTSSSLRDVSNFYLDQITADYGPDSKSPYDRQYFFKDYYSWTTLSTQGSCREVFYEFDIEITGYFLPPFPNNPSWDQRRPRPIVTSWWVGARYSISSNACNGRVSLPSKYTDEYGPNPTYFPTTSRVFETVSSGTVLAQDRFEGWRALYPRVVTLFENAGTTEFTIGGYNRVEYNAQ